jgi:hypothetical protein
MDKLMQVDIPNRRCGSGAGYVSFEIAVHCSESAESRCETLCERLSRLDCELESVRADPGVRGDPGIAASIEVTGVSG